jgi:uncharacterized protein
LKQTIKEHLMKPSLFISGATGGLGSAFALECARRGMDLTLTDLNPRGVEFARSLAETFAISADYYPCDLTDRDDRTRLYAELAGSGRKFWGLVNVAGLDYEGEFLGRTREEVLRIINLNIESTLDTTYAILKMREIQKWFRLVNVCSMAAFYPMPYKAVYAASKRFLLNFSSAVRQEIRPFGTVTALCPSGLPTTTENMRAIFAQGFWGKVTAVEPAFAARGTMDAALKGKALYVPGWINRVIYGLGSLVPEDLQIALINSRWQSSRTADLVVQNGVPLVHRPEPQMKFLDLKLVADS